MIRSRDLREDTKIRSAVFEYAKKKYGTDPEYLWMRFPGYAVFRRKDNEKWYGIVMDVPRERLAISGSGRVDILNVRIDDLFELEYLVRQPGIMRGYHFARGNWISVLLDGTVPPDVVFGLLDESYRSTGTKEKKKKIRPPKEWIIPANPKYYDVERAFDGSDEIDWKHGNGVEEGDTVFLYVAAPVSAILYKCAVIKTGIPFDYKDENLSIKALMRIKLLARYDPSAFTFEELKNGYGIFAVRGPRGVPHSLSAALRKAETKQTDIGRK